MVTIIKSDSKNKDLERFLPKTEPAKKLDAKKFSGILKLNADPLLIQKKMRDEWK
jgi:hypothetical protein